MTHPLSEEEFKNLAKFAFIWATKLLESEKVREDTQLSVFVSGLRLFTLLCVGWPAPDEEVFIGALQGSAETDEPV
jgi:hypothetical protein